MAHVRRTALLLCHVLGQKVSAAKLPPKPPSPPSPPGPPSPPNPPPPPSLHSYAHVYDGLNLSSWSSTSVPGCAAWRSTIPSNLTCSLQCDYAGDGITRTPCGGYYQYTSPNQTACRFVDLRCLQTPSDIFNSISIANVLPTSPQQSPFYTFVDLSQLATNLFPPDAPLRPAPPPWPPPLPPPFPPSPPPFSPRPPPLSRWAGITTDTVLLVDVPAAQYTSSVEMTFVKGVALRLRVGTQLVKVTSVRPGLAGGTLLGFRVLSATQADAQALAAALETLPDNVRLSEV